MKEDPYAALRRFRNLEHRQTRLPVPLTPFIGRENELREVRDLLLREDVRLVTLIGAGGTGKTRLAIEVAKGVRRNFPDGTFFISLASITNADLVLPTIASSLGLMQERGHSLSEILSLHLRDRRVLLVLDNFEQVVAAAFSLGELLGNCANLKVLVTSREGLRLSFEMEYSVPPLDLPNLKEMPTLDALRHYAAIELFVQRAQAVKADFEIRSNNARAIAEVAVRLDGLPLALELAAAQVRNFTPEEMLKKLQKRLAFLTRERTDLPARQRTLRDTIAWSFDLLGAEEKMMFARFSVFVGDFSLEAAEAVCDGPAFPLPVAEGISKLVEKSLLERKELHGESRFRMLETIREFAFEALERGGESEILLQRHGDYFLTLAENAELKLRGPDQATALARLDVEYDSLCSALRWSTRNNQLDKSLRFVCALWRFWHVRGYLTEGRQWMMPVLAATQLTRNSFHAEAMLGAAVLAIWQKDFRGARALLNNALTLSQDLREREIEAFVLIYMSIITGSEGDFGETSRLEQESLRVFRSLGNKWGTAFALNQSGVTAREQGDYDAASRYHGESLRLFREVGDKRNVARALGNLGVVLEWRGECDEAETLLNECLFSSRELNDRVMIAECLFYLGSLATKKDDFDAARSLLAQSLVLSQEIGHIEVVARCLEEFAACAWMQEQPERVALLLGSAEALREATNSPISPAYRIENQRYLANARAALGSKAFSALWIQGRGKSVEQAAAYALAATG
jgi:predicted ATPase